LPTLSKELRRKLENTVADARKIAEAGAEQALKQLGVHRSESAPVGVSEEKVRNHALCERLRAHGKQLGDRREPNGVQELKRLRQACAYEHWHRMLFARFLAENNLLIHPVYAEPISLDEVKELAREQNVTWLSVATSYAQQMLLEVFRPNDPVLKLALPPETNQMLDDKLAGLPTELFIADDSLGWVYQFWQSEEKEAVNRSEVKIGADQLSPVTQLFTDDYMVLFLLHNTLGAWWTAKRRAEGKDPKLPHYEWTYLRLTVDGLPAAGGFCGWPRAVRELRVFDPCMGSGHFLAFALPILIEMRMEEEGGTLEEAIQGTLRDNIYGLELDARCSQIAAFNLALTVWRIVGRPVPLPAMNLACSGLGINATEKDWMRLAGDDDRARQTMQKLYAVFRHAPTLGSLINPTRFGRELFAAELSEVWPLLQSALGAERTEVEDAELAVAAKGLLTVAQLLSQKFTLVSTNVPYLGRGRQNPILVAYCDEFHRDARADLANCFVDRCVEFCVAGGTVAVVTKQELLFQGSYEDQRRRLLGTVVWNLVAILGPRAFEALTGERVIVALLGLSLEKPTDTHDLVGWNVSRESTAAKKALALRTNGHLLSNQLAQRNNPDARVLLSASDGMSSLGEFAVSYQGIKTGDDPRMRRFFWELDNVGVRWRPFQSTVKMTTPYGGRESVIDWEHEGSDCARLQGLSALKELGVAVSQSRGLPSTTYTGDLFDSNIAPVIPRDPANLNAIYAFCKSAEFAKEMEKIDPKFAVANSSVTKVPFNLSRWQEVASQDYPEGLPVPEIDDPTQWIFSGHPKLSAIPLQVAVARLVGYRWPRQAGCSFLNYEGVENDTLSTHADQDGIVCLSPLNGRIPAADRLRALLSEAYGAEWSAAKLTELLRGHDSLELWLRDRFFAEHCQVFDNHPFVWHVWDGRTDGFHAFVSYHKLAASGGIGRKTLERLIYTDLGDWLSRQKAEVESGTDGADGRLSAALHLKGELEGILVGEKPYDLFVRWKQLHHQPVGWEPDLNDGVRLNIRPWLTATPYQPSRKDACVLRVTPRMNFDKDRGKEPFLEELDFPWFWSWDGKSGDFLGSGKFDGVRWNDLHYSLKEKHAARERKKAQRKEKL
jgi:hypothetical protein